MVKKQSAGWAQPLVFYLLRIPGLRLASCKRIINESGFSDHTANPVDYAENYLKKSYSYVRISHTRMIRNNP